MTGFYTRADFTANLQVFCREKSGKGGPVIVSLFPCYVRGVGGHAGHAVDGKMGTARSATV